MYQPVSQRNPDEPTQNVNHKEDTPIPSTDINIKLPKTENSNLLVQLTWKNVTVKVAETKKENGKTIKGFKTILDNLSGTVYPGQFLAILGSTGAGKSTLLNFLSGNFISPNLITSGEVHINGVPKNSIDYSKFTAFFQQDDIFTECLTIEECLQFAARCKCAGTDEAIKKRIDELMDEMSLTQVKTQAIGGKVTK